MFFSGIWSQCANLGQFLTIVPQLLEKIDNVTVRVVYDFAIMVGTRNVWPRFGKEYRSCTTERLHVNGMLWNQGNDFGSHALLAAIVGERWFHAREPTPAGGRLKSSGLVEVEAELLWLGFGHGVFQSGAGNLSVFGGQFDTDE